MVKTRAQTPQLLNIALLVESNVFSCSVLKCLKTPGSFFTFRPCRNAVTAKGNYVTKIATDVYVHTFPHKLLLMLLTRRMHVNRSKRPSQCNYGRHSFPYNQRVQSRSEYHCTSAIQTHNILPTLWRSS